MTRLHTKVAMALAAGGLAIGGLAVAAGSEGERLEAMLDGISLTDEQEAIADRVRDEAQENEEALAAAHSEMVDVFLSELERREPDRGRLYAEVDRFVDEIGDVSRDHLDGVLDLYEALDRGQRATFRSNIEELREQADMFGEGQEPE